MRQVVDPSRDGGDVRAARRGALERLVAEVGEVVAGIARTRERVARVRAAEGTLAPQRRLPRTEAAAAREAGWELQRLEAELRRPRAEFVSVQDGSGGRRALGARTPR